MENKLQQRVLLLAELLLVIGTSFGSAYEFDLLDVFTNSGNSIERFHLETAFEKLNQSSACLNDSMDYLEALKSLLPTGSVGGNPDTQWATALLDATGKIPTGILEGNMRWMGSFSECLKVRANKPNSTTEERFRGQYCTLIARTPPSNKTETLGTNEQAKDGDMFTAQGVQLGLCWPSSCNGSEIKTVLNALIKKMKKKIFIKIPDVKITVAQDDCHVKADSPNFDATSIVVIVVFSLFALLILAATLFEIVCINKDIWSNSIQSVDTDEQGKLARTLLSFSAYRNGKKILNTGNSSQTLTCIHGIRFLSMTWVVLGHTYAFSASVPFKNMIAILDVIRSYPMQIIFTGTFSVDTFYTISGLLLTYLFLNEMNKSGGDFGLKKLFLYYFHRYWRLTPAYAMGIAFTAGIWNYMGDGPLWTASIVQQQENCRNYWWRNLFYIQNLYDQDHSCFPVGWYLGTDMQFYAISLPILIALYRMPVVGLGLMGIFFATTTITTGLIIYIRDLPSHMGQDLLHMNIETTEKFMKYVYTVPWCRMGPYLVGMFTGYIIFLNKTPNRLKLHKAYFIVGWLAAAILGLTLIFGYYSYIDGDAIMPRWLRALDGAGSRTAWGCVVCWVIYACISGYGGFVNQILSWKALVPLSRLTYSAYLVHFFVITWFYSIQQTSYYFTHYLVIIMFLGMLVISMGVAFLFSLAFESPMMELEKIYILPKKDDATREEHEALPYFRVNEQPVA